MSEVENVCHQAGGAQGWHISAPESGNGSVARILVVDNLHTEFRSPDRIVPAVRGISFELRRGEVLGIVGESGSGKSTMLMSILRMLPGNAAITRGSIRFGDVDLLKLTDEEMRRIRGSRISLIPQRPMSSLSPVSRIQTQLRRFLDSPKPKGHTETAAIASMLDRVGLRAVRERIHGYPYEFSGGQLQRILIAIATLSARPDVLLADEPTSTLDATVQSQILSLLLKLRRDLGLSIIFVTHDLGIVAQVCDRVGVMYAGELVEVADIQPLFSAPKHPYTQALLATVPSRHRLGERLASIPGSVAEAGEALVGCPFAPRCSSVMDICRKITPTPRRATASVVRCHLYPEDEVR